MHTHQTFRFFAPALLLALVVLLLAPNVALAAISFVDGCENSAISGGDVTLTLPATEVGDLVVVAYADGDADGVNFNLTVSSPASTFTEIADLFSNDTNEASLGVYYDITDDSYTQVTVDGLGGADASVAAVCMVFRGVDTTTPMDVTATTDDANLNTMHPNPPSIDHNNPSGVWTVIAGASGHSLNTTSVTYTFPTGYTTNAREIGQIDTSDITVGIGYRSSGVSDPEDPGTMTHSGTDNAAYSWAAVTMALRPAASAAVPTVQTGVSGNVSPASATLFGNITDDGGASITQHGFATSTSATLSSDVSTTTLGSGTTGEYSGTVLLSVSDTTYYYRAYAQNSAGYGFGSILSFNSGNTTVTRSIRLFEGFIIKLISGTIKFLGI